VKLTLYSKNEGQVYSSDEKESEVKTTCKCTTVNSATLHLFSSWVNLRGGGQTVWLWAGHKYQPRFLPITEFVESDLSDSGVEFLV
jgi:hypothetical protein